MNSALYPKTGTYRELYSNFDLFFEEVGLIYGKSFCQEVKREALGDYLRLGNLERIDEIEILKRVKLRHPEIRKSLEVRTSMIIGAAA